MEQLAFLRSIRQTCRIYTIRPIRCIGVYDVYIRRNGVYIRYTFYAGILEPPNVRRAAMPNRQACCGVFVTAQHPVSRISNFGRVVTCNKAIIMARNKYNKKYAITFNGVFVCLGSQNVSHCSKIGRVMIHNTSIIMANIICDRSETNRCR